MLLIHDAACPWKRRRDGWKARGGKSADGWNVKMDICVRDLGVRGAVEVGSAAVAAVMVGLGTEAAGAAARDGVHLFCSWR